MMRAWFTQHASIFFLTLKRLIAAPATSLLSILVIGITLSLPVGVYVLIQNMQTVSGQTTGLPQMSLFLRLDAGSEVIGQLKQHLEKDERVVRFQFVSKDVALYRLQQDGGFPDIAAILPRNPLPDAFIVDTQPGTADTLEHLRQTMQSWPGVEHVQYDSAWIERLNALLRLGQLAVLILATLLSTAVIAIIFNTIRLQILIKREEIEISRLIGATDDFIQRPFLYFGTLQGLIGGIVALLVVAFAVHMLNEEMVTLTQLYDLDLQIKLLSLEDSLSLLVFSAWLGWLGARISVANHLRLIESR